MVDPIKATKDCNDLIKDLIQNYAAAVQSVKDQAAQNVKDIRQNYAEKERRVLRLIKENTRTTSDKLKDIAKEDFKFVDSTKATKDFNDLTKDLIQNYAVAIQSVKDQAAQNLKDIRQNYAENERRVLRLIKENTRTSSDSALHAAKEYERILQEYVFKLKDIAKEDFKFEYHKHLKILVNIMVDPTKPTKDLNDLTKDLIQKDSAIIQSVKHQAAQNLRDVRQNYAEKEERVLRLIKENTRTSSDSALNASKQYERMLQENVFKLKDIAKEDFKTSNENAQNQVEETKHKLHGLISGADNDPNAKSNFANTAGAIFSNVNQKIRKDLVLKHETVEQTRSSLAPGYSKIFVHNRHKPPEQIEAEQLLQRHFEEEILEFNAQLQRDFEDINLKITENVDEAKARVGETLQSAINQGISKTKSIEPTETKSLPNLPSKSAVEQNINSLLNQTGQDFQRAREKMLNDVSRQQQQINEKTKYIKKKILNKNLFGMGNDDHDNDDDDDDDE